MPWLQIVKYGLLALLLGSLVVWHVHNKNEALKELKIELQAEATAKARAQEQVLNYDAFKLGREKDEKINSINGKLADALRLLRERPARPANPSTPASGEACTGTKLFREDAEFLTREAARADQLAAERDYYYERYENARRTLAGEKQDEGRSGKTSDTKPVS